MEFLAVGTDMDEARFRTWIPTARRLTVGSLPGFALGWNKRSAEGGKLAPSSTDPVVDAARASGLPASDVEALARTPVADEPV